MDKLTPTMAEAFFKRQPQKIGNTEIRIVGDGAYLYILDTIPIAKWEKGNAFIEITDGGYQSKVAKERLSGILERTYFRIEDTHGGWFLTTMLGKQKIKMELSSWHKVPITYLVRK